jgi:adenylate cyclase
MRSLLSRLRERKLVHWAVAYLAGSWLVLQVLDLLAQPFAWPMLVMRAATVLLAIGFLAALVVAWYHGERGAQRATGIEVLMLTGILALAAAAVAFVSRTPGEPTFPVAFQTTAEQGSIAVLPFADMSAARDQEFFADGLTEELLNVLAQLPELRVASRTSSFAYRGAQVPIDSIARALRVAHVLEGSVRRDGDLLRITAQLIDAGTGYHVWSESYDRDVGSVFAVQDEIARAIVRALELKLGGGRSGAPLARQQTTDPEAHTLVLRATQLRRSTQRALVEEAVRLLQQAIARDSTYAQAWALLADSYTRLDYLGFAARNDVVPKAREAAERARRLDPQSADAEFALGLLARDYDWDTRGAEAHFRRAIELRPSMASAYTVLAWSLAQLGRGAEAIDAAARAVELDPVQGGLHTNLASVYVYAGQPQQAVEAYRRALALGEDAITLGNLALSYADLGQHPEAIVCRRARARTCRRPRVCPGGSGLRLRARRPPRRRRALHRRARGAAGPERVPARHGLCGRRESRARARRAGESGRRPGARYPRRRRGPRLRGVPRRPADKGADPAPGAEVMSVHHVGGHRPKCR